ncbi:glycosyltransferase [bacterium]|nr:glycosyltransferase [bacterium]
MRILEVNKFYFLKGGAERYFFNITDVLRSHGHEIIPFSMENERNLNSPYTQYFVSNTEFFEKKPIEKYFHDAMRVLYSFEAKRNIERLIKETKPDLAHLHNIAHQISPSILHSLKKYNIPVVQTLHDYKLICPSYLFLSREEICERCKGNHYYQAVIRKCFRNQILPSLLGCLEAYLHKMMKIYKNIDLFIAPSKFMRNKMIECGLPEDKVVNIPNFVNVSDFKPNYHHQNYFLYFGRISPEKGIGTLIKAMQEVKRSKLVIVGEGRLLPYLKKYACDHQIKNIEFLGYKEGKELKEIIGKAMFTIVPSEVYENFPYTILESYALGKPVIGANLGGIPELIEDQRDGLLFEAFNFKDLASKINYFLDNQEILLEMGKKTREKVEKFYDSEIHYQRLIKIFQSLLKQGIRSW